MTTRLGFPLVLLCIFLNVASSGAQQPPAPPTIANVTIAGANGGGYSVGANGLNAFIGAWANGYRVAEGVGTTTMRITINVNDGGQLVFAHWLQSFDTTEYDWVNIFLETPGGPVIIVSRAGRKSKWEPPCCIYFSTRTTPVAMKLDAWKQQQVTLVVELTSDGYGDQTQMNLVNVNFPACSIPYPADLTDPAAIAQENAESLDVDNLTQPMKDALACLQTKIRAAGGQFDLNGTYLESAYRNPEYQSHLDEIWTKWQKLKSNTAPECAAVKQYIRDEITAHRMTNLGTQPASRSGGHPRGEAVDVTAGPTGLPLATIVQLAGTCQLNQPLPVKDANHLVLRPPSN